MEILIISSMYLKFPCTGCGVCCKNISHIIELKEFDRGDGQCIHLDNDECSIYHSRPQICRVDEMYDTYFKDQFSEEDLFMKIYWLA